MLSEWLAPQTVDSFVATHLRQAPMARPGAALGTANAFGWEELGRMLERAASPDLLVVARSRLLKIARPRCALDLRGLLNAGTGIVVRHADRDDAALGALAAAFARDLPGEVHVQIFATAAETHGFGWHYDFEDVFIVQTRGAKDYFFRANTVDLETPVGVQPDFERVRLETTPVATARLVPGDWLYIPARWWHVAVAAEDSLSLSLGHIRSLRPSTSRLRPPAAP